MREVVAALIEVCGQFQTIPTLDVVLVHHRRWQYQGQRPTIVAYALLERLGAECADTLHLRENLLSGADFITCTGRVIINEHMAYARCLDVVVSLAVER